MYISTNKPKMLIHQCTQQHTSWWLISYQLICQPAHFFNRTLHIQYLYDLSAWCQSWTNLQPKSRWDPSKSGSRNSWRKSGNYYFIVCILLHNNNTNITSILLGSLYFFCNSSTFFLILSKSFQFFKSAHRGLALY